MKHLNANIGKVVEYITFTGAGLIRPIYAAHKLQYEIIPLGNYLPTKYDFDAHIDQTIIKKIVGHAGAMSLTERVYTHLDINELIEAIDQI